MGIKNLMIKPQKIFFSYGHDKNSRIVDRIKEDLEKRGHSVWIDKSQIRFGDDWREKIVSGIMDTDSVLSFLSRHSIREPGVCLDELHISLGLKHGNIKTILLENENEVKPPASVSNIQWLDLSMWDSFDLDSNEFLKWYNEKVNEIIKVVESKEMVNFTGVIEELKDKLNPYLSDTKAQYLLSKPYTKRLWLEDLLKGWMDKSNSNAFILIGSPGIGKSAFSAHTMHYNHNVASAIFCEWDKPRSVDSKTVIKTLAFNLATKICDYRSLLIKITRSKTFLSDINKQTPDELFDYLIINPTSYLIDSNRESAYVIIDGLDEAIDNNLGLAETLVKGIKRLPKWIRFIITSRPENSIINLFSTFDPLIVKTDNENNINDIKNYLIIELRDYLLDKEDKLSILDKIINNCEGSFLYASLFIEEVKNNPEILDDLNNYPKGLNQFYLLSFTRKFKDNCNYDLIKEVLGYIIVSQNLPIAIIKNFLKVDSKTYALFINEMSSFISKSYYTFNKYNKLDAYTLIHKSLYDFLINPELSGKFYIDYDKALTDLLNIYNNVLGDLDKKELFDLDYEVDNLPYKYIQDNIAYLFIKSKQWSKFISFLVDKNTPFSPYYDFIELIPKFIQLNDIADRLVIDIDKYTYLEKKRSEGKIELVKRLIESIIKKYSINSLEKEIFYIYTDVLHLSGKYKEAVKLDQDYLSSFSINEIINDETLLHIYTRMLHHSKFFMGTQELIIKTNECINLIKDRKFIKEYLELLIMAANLGTLSGDLMYAKECNKEALKLAKENKLSNYELRAARKYVDLLINDEEYENAIKFLIEYINPNCYDDINRYQLYLYVSFAEAKSLLRGLDEAYNILKNILKIAKERNIKGWIAHIYLSIAKLMLEHDHFNEALFNIDTAKNYYLQIEQEWGIINCNLLLLNLEIKKENKIKSIAILDEVKSKIKELEYNYYLSYLDCIINNIYIENYKLLFI